MSSIKLYEHQKNIVGRVLAEFNTHKEVCLAAAPGAGKTEMALFIASQFPGKVGISCHGQSVLLEQMVERGRKYGISINKRGSKIKAFLPHSEKTTSNKYDLLIVDEAHQYYLANGRREGMVQKIMNESGAKNVLLLTGTPSKLLSAGIHTEVLPLFEISPEFYAPLAFHIARFDSAYSDEEYSETGELLKDLSKDATLKGFNNALVALLYHLHLKGDLRHHSEESFNNKTKQEIINRLGKTMIACQSAKQMNYISSALDGLKIKHISSTAASDISSEGFAKFTSDPTIKVLLVINRGRLGFNYDALVAMVDFTITRNPDLIYQMCMRVARVDTVRPDSQKVFIKVTPSAALDMTCYYTNAALYLMTREGLTNYKGMSSINNMKIPVIKDSATGDELNWDVVDSSGRMIKDASYLEAMADSIIEEGARDTWEDNCEEVDEAPLTFKRIPRLDVPSMLREVELGINKNYGITHHTSLHDLRFGLGITTQHSAKHKIELLEFIKTNSRKPNQRSKNRDEKSLSGRMQSYCSPSSGLYDKEFKAQVEELINSLNKEN
jgi:superfamily II DNA or RNA helicase